MAIEQLLIAKTGAGEAEWLPLRVHLEDTLGTMKYLIKEYISDSFAVSCGINPENLKKSALFLAYVHDIGKATMSFQYKISKKLPELRSRLEHCGLRFPDSYDPQKMMQTPHGLAGEVILRYLGCPEGFAAVVGSHHGIPASNRETDEQSLDQRRRDIVGYENYFGSADENRPMLEAVWQSILQTALDESGFQSIQKLPRLSRRAQMLLTGLLIMADWIASNTEFFPLMCWEDDEACASVLRVQTACDNMKFTSMWKPVNHPDPAAAFRECFDFPPSSVQLAVMEAVKQTAQPGLLILEAPMGCGKTEAALAAAELMAEKLHKNGLFFGLPTQATANGIFPRICNWCEHQSMDEYHSIQLRHGSAALNEYFRNIQRGIPDTETDSGILVHSWFCNPKKACLAEFVVATVDQLLMAALKRKHVMLLHLGLSEKVVIIDECHAYDAYMNQYLERALQWLGAYHTPVILLSATLPAKRRMELVRAYLHLEESDKGFEETSAYPLLTWTDGEEIRQQALPYDGVHRQVGTETCTLQEAFPRITSAVGDGGCVGIIVNTVKRAQQIAAVLREETTAEVMLYHAQFTFPDRADREQKLLARIGKGSSPQERRGLIVVGTQVLEQSLDIDVDLLVTDICPMDLLLQRIGRLHRHKHDDRPESVNAPLCLVLTDELEEETSGSKKIYGDWLLSETYARLPERIQLPDDISGLVQGVYSAEDSSPAYQKYQQKQTLLKERANAFLLNEVMGRGMHGLLARNVSDASAEASVRDGISSVEVLLMQRYADGTVHFLPNRYDGAAVSGIPAEEECRRIAEQKLRLPSSFCQPWNIDKTIGELEQQCGKTVEKWQQSHWLKGQLVLFLDEELTGELQGCRLWYSPETGLNYDTP